MNLIGQQVWFWGDVITSFSTEAAWHRIARVYKGSAPQAQGFSARTLRRGALWKCPACRMKSGQGFVMRGVQGAGAEST